MSRRMVWALAALLCGCAAQKAALPGGVISLLPEAEIRPKAAEKYPDADAVVLKHSIVYRLGNSKRGEPDVTRVTLRKVTAVRTERGRNQVADFKLRLPSKTKILDAKALVRQPDGTSRELSPADVLQLATPHEIEDEQLLFALRFPDVRVGSVLEYALVYEYPNVWTYLNLSAHDDYPVVDYDVAIDCDKSWACHMATFNTDFGPFVEKTEEGFQRLRWQASALAPRPNESYAPHWRTDTAWWANRLKFLAPSAEKHLGEPDWSLALKWYAESAFVEGGWSEGFDPSRVTPWVGCSDELCKFTRTLEWVRSNIELSGEDTFKDARPIVEVIKSRRGSDGERAIVLARLLQEAGFEVWLTGVVFADEGRLFKEFPAAQQVSQALVFVRARGNLKAQYVDLLCDHCGEDEIRPSAVGVESIQFRASPADPIPLVESRFVTVEAGTPKVSKTEFAMTAVVTQKGELRARIRETLTSMNAIPNALRWRNISPKDAAEMPLRLARGFKLTTPARNFVPPKCDLRAGLCVASWDLDWPHATDVDGDQIVVSLPLFTEQFRGVWTARRRYRDLAVYRPDVHVETALITLPPDYEVVELPASSTRKSALLDSEIAVSKEADGIHIKRTLTARAGRRPKSEFAELQAVLKHYDSLAGDILVLRKKTVPAPSAQK